MAGVTTAATVTLGSSKEFDVTCHAAFLGKTCLPCMKRHVANDCALFAKSCRQGIRGRVPKEQHLVQQPSNKAWELNCPSSCSDAPEVACSKGMCPGDRARSCGVVDPGSSAESLDPVQDLCSSTSRKIRRCRRGHADSTLRRPAESALSPRTSIY